MLKKSIKSYELLNRYLWATFSSGYLEANKANLYVFVWKLNDQYYELSRGNGWLSATSGASQGTLWPELMAQASEGGRGSSGL